jgi:hypothetical protein
MPNLATELEHLQLANEHVGTAQRTVSHLKSRLDQERQAGFPTTATEGALTAARQGLAEFVRHRDLIAATVEGLKAGRLPGS